MTATATWHIDAPVEDVFGFFEDPHKWSKVALMDVHDIKTTKEGVGTHFAWDVKVGPMRFGGFDVLTDVVPNKSIQERSSVAAFGKWAYRFEPEGQGTKVTIEVSPQSFWGIPPLSRLLELGLTRMGRVTVPRMKAEIERISRQRKAAADRGRRKTTRAR